eukprot:UN29818
MTLYNSRRLECITFTITLIATCVLKITYGLGLGIISSVILKLAIDYNIEIGTLGIVQTKDCYYFAPITETKASDFYGITVVQPKAQVYYCNATTVFDTILEQIKGNTICRTLIISFRYSVYLDTTTLRIMLKFFVNVIHSV